MWRGKNAETFWFLQLFFCWAYDWVHHSGFFHFHWVVSTILTPIITIWAITVTFTLYAVITCMSKCASLSYNFKKLISFFLYFFSEPQDPGSSDAGMSCILHTHSNLYMYIIVLYRV